MIRHLRAFIQKFLGAIVFYTQVPLPPSLPLDFDGIAGFAPIVGLLIGGILLLVGVVLFSITSPLLMAAIVVALWIWITGALHLDGAMDMADGLGCMDQKRRLDIMRDPHSGAFGIMTAIVIVLLKTAALAQDVAMAERTEILALPLVCGWARWGQLTTIIRFPYLRAEGKGKLHKASIQGVRDALPSLFILLGCQLIPYFSGDFSLQQTLMMPIVALFFSWGFGTWISGKFGGHTGDTYGAVVEWTETVLVCFLALT